MTTATVEPLEDRRLLSGDLDPSFGAGGKVVTDVTTYFDSAGDVAVTPDGGILMGGGAGGQTLLAKYRHDGSPDPAFGTAGIVQVSQSLTAQVTALAVQADGKIVTVGSGVISRFTPDGELDPTWDNDGTRAFAPAPNTLLAAVAVQADGKVVVGGQVPGQTGGWVVARFNANGSPDTTFDSDGIAGVAFPDYNNAGTQARGIDFQGDGKIVLVGNVAQSTTYGLGVARLNPDGSTDTTFEGDGHAVFNWGLNSYARGEEVRVLPNGKLLVAGNVDNRPAVYQLNADGSPDSTFGGGDGLFNYSADAPMKLGLAQDMATLSDGHIVLATTAITRAMTYTRDLAALVLKADGTPDTSFGAGGVASADFGGGESGYAVAVQGDGNVVVAGHKVMPDDKQDFVLARFLGPVAPPSPAVAAVYIGSTTWAPAFYQYLASSGQGDAKAGFKVADGAAQLKTLPWLGANQVSIRFTRDIVPNVLSLTVHGVNTGTYAFLSGADGFRYDPATLTGTWTFAQPLTADRLELSLETSGPTAVRNAGGELLDGEWADGADAYPSGDGDSGGDFVFHLNLLPGDADRAGGRVTAIDPGYVKARLNRASTDTAPPAGAQPYSIFADVTADGRIAATDLGAVKARLNNALPTLPPPPPEASTASQSITRDLLYGAG